MVRHNVVDALRDAVEDRRVELEMSAGEFVAATGLSRTTVDNIRNGYDRHYADEVKWAVCRALRWRSDSIDRLR